MADNYLITGYWGEPHVTAENDRGINASIFGTGRFVLPVGQQFRAEYIGNNTIRLYDGMLMDNGAAAAIPFGEFVDLLIPNAGQGMNRNDLIVFQYSQDASTLIESGTFVVIQGAETEGTATDPELTQGDLLSSETTFEQMPLWRVSVSGAAISAPTRLFTLHYGCLNAGGGQFAALNTKYNSPSSEGRVAFFNGATPAGGAGIWLYGNDCDGEGKFSLQVYDVATNTYRSFQGLPNGDLLWNGGWLNPPMVAGTEYKTVERYQGKAVYAKLVDAGALPNNTAKTLSLGVSTPNIISIDVLAENGKYTVMFPYVNANGNIGAFFYVNGSTATFRTFEDLSAYNGKILVKYTK